MAALSAAYDTKPKDGRKQRYLMKASTSIWKGALVFADANGLAVPYTDAANLKFLGVAYGSNTSAASGNYYIIVLKNGTHLYNAFASNTFGQTDVGKEVYAGTDNQVTITAGDVTNAYKVGAVEEFPSTTTAYVRIDNYVR